MNQKKIKLHLEWKDENGKSWKTAEFLLFMSLLQRYKELTLNKNVDCRFYYTIGSRSSAKTHSFLTFICMLFLTKDHMFIIYIFRDKDAALTETRKDIVAKLEQYFGYITTYGAGGSFNAKDNVLKNGRNQIIFRKLNAEKMKVNDGGAVGLTTWEDADAIIAFFEEATKLEEKLVSTAKQSLKGGPQTQIIEMHAANPWSPFNWYVKRCNEMLPEDEKELEEKGYQLREFIDPNLKQKVFFMRNNVLTNPYLKESEFQKLNSWKNIDYEWWKIVFLGVSGSMGDNIYAQNMKLMKPVDYKWVKNGTGYFQGGVDWGYGTGSSKSATAMHFGKLSLDPQNGCQIIAEKTLWNNQGIKRTDIEQYDEIIKFFKTCYETYKYSFKVYVDYAASAYFTDMINSRLINFGLTINEIEFLPCKKYDTQDRIRIMNLMIARGWFRIDKLACPDLNQALLNAHWTEKKVEREGIKLDRNHDETHWLHSVEYLLDDIIYEYADIFSYK